LPNKVRSKWPAIILADRRTVKVPGRITLLIVSIKTMKGIRKLGVLIGTKWANIYFILLIQPNSMKANHRGAASVRAIIKWLEPVKIYGNRPRRLFMEIIIRMLIKINVLLYEEDFNNVLNSL